MIYRTFLLLVFFLFNALNGFSDVFVVTSNADSGTGTLREALTLAAANGTAVKDYINFNIADVSEAGRTIILLSNLPTINSDMLIDGSTQPGTSLSVNGAKIIIQGGYKVINNVVNYVNYFLIKNVNDVEIDGLIIKGAPDIADYYNPGRGIAFAIDGTNRTIRFGRPGKGNVMYDSNQSIQATVGGYVFFPTKSQTDTVILKNNLIGVKEDGVTVTSTAQSSINLNYVFNAIIGGDTPQERNVFYGVFALSPNYINDPIAKNVSYTIRNNIFAANSMQQIPIDSSINAGRNQMYVSIGASDNVDYSVSSIIDIRDNVFGCSLSMQGFQKLDLQVQHNFFGTSSDKENALPIALQALHLGYMQGTILIGGDDLTKGNIFTNCVQDSAKARSLPVIWIEDYTQPISPLFKIELSHNSFYCNNNAPLAYSVNYDKKPVIPLSVDNLSNTAVDGTAVPNSRVELYYTDLGCKQCQPKTYLTTVNANANGKWTYSGQLLTGYGVMASATSNHLTSEFTDTRIYSGALQITSAECTAGGSIIGYLTANAKKVKWVNLTTRETVSTNLDLVNVPAGKYRLMAEQFGCVVYSIIHEIEDSSPIAHDQFIKIIQPSCGNGGSITGLYTAYAYKTEWIDTTNTVISNQLNLINRIAGKYTLRMTGARGCVKTYGPITLTNTTGPNIDQSAPNIQPSACGSATGSITNVISTGTGTLSYSWKNEQQQEIAKTKDLLDKPAGKYTLQVTDQSTCGPVSSSELTIPELNGITMDDSQITKQSTTCSHNNGSITNIKITGATSYQWFDKDNGLVSTQNDLTNVLSGTYHLIAANATCSKQSPDYTIDNIPGYINYPSTKTSIKPTCGNTGSIQVLFTDATNLPKALKWVDAEGNIRGTDALLDKIEGGTYKLYVTDNNNCESFYESYILTAPEPLTFDLNSAIVTDATCGLPTGSIKGPKPMGGTPPYSYTWLGDNQKKLANTPDLVNVGPGDYTIMVVDTNRCAIISSGYTVRDQSVTISPPSVSNLQLCAPGEAIATINNPSAAYKYRLYDSPDALTPIAEQTDPKFKITVKKNVGFYVSQLSGTCESERVPLKVTVGLAAVSINNTITPNGDGNNDSWKISGIESYPNATVQIFNRNGQKVFESRGYGSPFDGRMNGQELPVGTYYYIISLNTKCDLISGSLLIAR